MLSVWLLVNSRLFILPFYFIVILSFIGKLLPSQWGMQQNACDNDVYRKDAYDEST